jgi:hypothetical protein
MAAKGAVADRALAMYGGWADEERQSASRE